MSTNHPGYPPDAVQLLVTSPCCPRQCDAVGSLLCRLFLPFSARGSFTCSTVTESVLLVSDVSVDSHSEPSFVSLHLRHSKTDIFGVGAVQYLGLVDGPICPVKALLAYLALRGPSPGPLFIHKNGAPLSRRGLVAAIRSALSGYGLDVSRFNGQIAASE